MFIAQAVRQLALFRQEAPDAERTLIVCAPRYTQAMLDAARESAELYGAGFITVETADSLIEYLNTGKDRAIAPIANLSIYAHGVPFKIALARSFTQTNTSSPANGPVTAKQPGW